MVSAIPAAAPLATPVLPSSASGATLESPGLSQLAESITRVEPLLRAIHTRIDEQTPGSPVKTALLGAGVVARIVSEQLDRARDTLKSMEDDSRTKIRNRDIEALSAQEEAARHAMQAEKRVLEADMRTLEAEKRALSAELVTKRAEIMALLDKEAKIADAAIQSKLAEVGVEIERRQADARLKVEAMLEKADADAKSKLANADADVRAKLVQAEAEVKRRLDKADSQVKKRLDEAQPSFKTKDLYNRSFAGNKALPEANFGDVALFCQAATTADLEARESAAAVTTEASAKAEVHRAQRTLARHARCVNTPFNQWDVVLLPLGQALEHMPVTTFNRTVRPVLFKVGPYMSQPVVAQRILEAVRQLTPQAVGDIYLWRCWLHLARWADTIDAPSSPWVPLEVTPIACSSCRRAAQCLQFALVREMGEARYLFRFGQDNSSFV
ncbi:hypothetical protein ACHAQA_010039 [Verticillium albo-atrum]